MKNRLFILFFVLLLAGCAQFSKSSIERRIEKVEHGLLSSYGDPPWKGMKLTERMQHHNVPGVSIAVINDFQLEWAKGYGVLESGSSEPVTPDTLFQTGSIAKPVVAVATLNFVERGILQLDDDVNRSLVSWKIPANRFTEQENVTLRYLLSHSAGVTVKGFRGYARGEVVPDLQQILDGGPPANSFPIRVAAVPGTAHRYSGGGYMIVQQLLEDITDESFPQIMQETILDPWGMRASTFEPTLPEELKVNTARGHRSDGSVIPGGWHTYPEMGAGGSMWSTPSDMAKFAIQVMHAYNGRADETLSHNMAIEMLTPQIDVRGLGPVIGDDGDGLFYFLHPGANDGFQNYLLAYPERGQGVVIMTNGDNGEALADEIKRSVSITYGWVSDNTYLYLGITISIVVIILGYLIVRQSRAKKVTAVWKKFCYQRPGGYNIPNMAEPYFTHLSKIVSQLGALSVDDVNLEVKHFFSGAALYANGKICASLSPAGFALKLPEDTRLNLLAEGKGSEFRFFPKGPVKKGYITLPDSTLEDKRILQGLIDLSVSYVAKHLNSSTSIAK